MEVDLQGFLSQEDRQRYFPNIGIQELRDILEQLGYDRHMLVEFFLTEVCIITPKGLLLQVRASDKGALGMWGGVLEDGEAPIDGAIREVKEETGISLGKEQMHFVGINPHLHRYANGDNAKFTSYRFVVRLDYVPNITLDNESLNYKYVKTLEECEGVLDQQKDFIRKVLSE